MAFRLKPKEEKFFSLLEQHAQLCYEAANLLKQAMDGDIEKNEALGQISVLEGKANELVMETMKRLHYVVDLGGAMRLYDEAWTRIKSH